MKVDLSKEELDLIAEGLGELPAKRTLPLILKLATTVQAPEPKLNGPKRGRPKKVVKVTEKQDGVVALDSKH